MKAKEMIELLSKMDPETNLMVGGYGGWLHLDGVVQRGPEDKVDAAFPSPPLPPGNYVLLYHRYGLPEVE